MANIVDLLIGLGIDSEEYESGIASADRASSGFIDKISGPLTTAVVGAFATGGAAVAGFAVHAVSQFANFQSSMNEVFTLLPGITDDAMGDMTDRVKQFSKDFGVLPEDVVPALYQSLSAGVPADNVFAFLEDANKAATAGVTDLEVAVNGISSVVNAYGSDVISSAKASDLLFTTVKLGKTNFEELSAAIFNVTPSAAAAGVKFETVTAALAAMTLQGVPTSVATTKLRATLDELSKAGTKTDTIFREIAGKSFKEFIAGGGDLQGALQLLEQHAASTNVGINDLFGSAEAGSTALLLTGKGTDAFTNALKGMDESAGATDLAFATMNSGITDAIDDLRASFAVFTLDIGEALAPAVQFLADQAGIYLPMALEWATTAVNNIIAAVTGLVAVFTSSGGSVMALFTTFEDGTSTFSAFLIQLGLGETTAAKVNGVISTLISTLAPLAPMVEYVGNIIANNLQPILLAIGTVIAVVVVGAIYSFIAGIVAVAAPIIAVIAVIALLYAAFENNFLGIRDIVTSVMDAVWNVVSVVIDQVAAFWATNGTDIVNTVTTNFELIRSTIANVLSIINIVVTTIFNAIAGFIKTNGATIQTYLSNTWIIIKNVIGAAVTLISGIIKAFLQILQGDWSGAWLTIKTTAATFLTQIWTAIKTAFDNVLILTKFVWDLIYKAIKSALDATVGWLAQTFIAILNNIRGLGDKAISAAASVGEGIASGVVNGIKNGASAIINAAKDAAMAALNAAKSALGIGSPSKLAAAQVGKPFAQGIVIGVNRMLGSVANAGAMAGAALLNGSTATAPAFSASATGSPAIGAASGGAGGITQEFNIEAHYAKYEDERTLRDTVRMESLLNAPATA